MKQRQLYAQRRALIRRSLKPGTIYLICWTNRADQKPRFDCLRKALHAAPDYVDAKFNLALLLQRNDKHAGAAEYWRHYLANEAQSEWAARARGSLKFCEMQVHISNS